MAALRGHSFFKRKHWDVNYCLKRCCAVGLNYRSTGSTIFIGGPSKPVPTSQKTHIFAGLLEPRSQPEYVGKHTGWPGSWNMDCFENDSTVLSESGYFLPWHVYCPVNVPCWLNQDNKNSGTPKAAMHPNHQLWGPEGKSTPLTILFMSASWSCWKE